MLRIYGVPVSVHTRKVIVAAIHGGIAHEVIPVVPVVADTLPANWDEISPTGKIPVIEQDGFSLFDSAAIGQYLDARADGPSLYPSAAADRGMALAIEQYAGGLFADVVKPLFEEVFAKPRLLDAPGDPAVIDSVRNQRLPAWLGRLEGFASRGDWLAGDALSVADVAVVSNLVTYRYIGEELDAGRYPRLAALFDRVAGCEPVAEALRQEQPAVASLGLDPGFLPAAMRAAS